MFPLSRRSGSVRVFVGSVAAGAALWAGRAGAAEYTWVGGSGGASFSDPANWSPAGGPPGAADTAIYAGVSVPSWPTSPIGGIELRGSMDRTGGFTVVGTSPSALLMVPGAGQLNVLEVSTGGVVQVPNGGVLMTDAPPPQRLGGYAIHIMSGAAFFADTVSCLHGDIGILGPIHVPFPGHTIPDGQLHVSRDLVLGHADAPASARGADPLATLGSAGNVTIGGVARVYADGFFYVDTATVTGGMTNTGVARITDRLNGALTNAGILLADRLDGYAPDGQATITGHYVQSGDGILREAINSPAFPAPLVVDGDTVELGGTIELTASPFARVHVGDRFHLVETDAPIVFTAAFAPDPAGFIYAPQLVPGEGLYALVVAVPEPILGLLAAPACGLLLRRRSRD